MVISGVGGLGHVAVQYAVAMGYRVIAVDVAADKLDLARALGAEITLNARLVDPADEVQRLIGGAHGALVTAVSPIAFTQAIGMLRRGARSRWSGCRRARTRPRSSMSCSNGSPSAARSSAPAPIWPRRWSSRPAARCAAEITKAPLADINAIFDRMKSGKIDGRMVLDMG